MKRSFIKSVNLLKQYNLIISDYKIIYNGSLLNTNEFTVNNISEGFVIYEELSI